jgi:uncharacterized OB-fold protein
MAKIENSGKTESGKKVKPVQVGLFHMPASPEDKPYLIGSKCRECGLISWPKRPVCPSCIRDDTEEEIALSTRAKLITFSLIGQQPKGFMYNIPFIQGNIQLPEGPILYTVVEGDANTLKLGQEMEVFLDKIAEDEEGNDIICYKFKPVEEYK